MPGLARLRVAQSQVGELIDLLRRRLLLKRGIRLVEAGACRIDIRNYWHGLLRKRIGDERVWTSARACSSWSLPLRRRSTGGQYRSEGCHG